MRGHVPAPVITRPFDPFVSPVDNSVISDAAQRREHNRRNDCEDVGNDQGVLRSALKGKTYNPAPAKRDIERAMHYLGQHEDSAPGVPVEDAVKRVRAEAA